MRQAILFQALAFLAALFKYVSQPTVSTFNKPILLTCEETMNFGDFICEDKISLLQLHQAPGIGPAILDEILNNLEGFLSNPAVVKGIGPQKEREIKKLLFLRPR